MTINDLATKRLGELNMAVIQLEAALAEETRRREEAERNLEAAQAQIEALKLHDGANVTPIRASNE